MPRVKRARVKPKAKRKASPRRSSASASSVRTLTKALGLNRTTVKDGLGAGRCPKGTKRDRSGQWKIVDLALAVREWHESATRPSPASTPTNGNGGPDLGSLSQAQIRVHNERAAQLRLLNLQREGRLIDRAAASRESFEIARTVRDAILGVPDRVSAELAAETDAGRVHRRLEEELRTALGALAETLAGAAHADDAGARLRPESGDAVH